MSTPKKKAVVSKRPSAEQIQDSLKWAAFVAASQVEWDNLSENWKDFFEVIGNTKSSSEEINQAIIKSMGENK
jgi:signal recognition particle subunit SEC65